jgi:transglutaminase-like putative cysteine protease
MKRIFLSLTFFLSCGAAMAAEPVAAEVDVIYTDVDTEYDIDAESRLTAIYGYGARILHERALEGQKTRGVSYSRSIQSAEVLEAYTQKADGQRLPVPKDNYQTTTRGGHDKGNPFFSDIEHITVVFPNVEVGDTVYLRYRIRDTESIFPGAVSFQDGFSLFSAIENGSITLRAPESLSLTREAHQLEEIPAVLQDGRVTYQWRYHNPQPRVWDTEQDEGIWRSNDSPSLYVSTFRHYADIAQAYAARALPKAEPDERVRAQAAEIVGEEKDPRERARLLYEWVSTHIDYAGNCIGIGAVVPRDLAVVLDNRMGDCKDKATLLQALLTAEGIASEQVLMGGGYDLPRTPVVSAVNHVINYLPQWNLYADATAENIPFGYLPRGAYGQPVIHVGAAEDENAVRVIAADEKQPPLFQQSIHTTLKLAADGGADGSVRVQIKGSAAAAWRAYFMELKNEQRDKFVENLFRRNGMRGGGTLETSDLAPALRLSDHFEVTMRFQVENLLKARSGVFPLYPLFSYDGGINRIISVDDSKTYQRDLVCDGTKLREIFDVTLEPGVQLTQLPESLTLDTPYLAFKSIIKRNKKGLRVERSLLDKTPRGVCSADYYNAWLKDAVRIAENLQQPALYTRKPRPARR